MVAFKCPGMSEQIESGCWELTVVLEPETFQRRKEEPFSGIHSHGPTPQFVFSVQQSMPKNFK